MSAAKRKPEDHRAGFVALLGPPNAGKSTLMNRILGEKLAIVSAKPQTTRSRILGIHSVPGAQLLFVDTPGIHEGSKPLDVALNDAVEEVARDCDVGVVLVDLARGWESLHDVLLLQLRAHRKAVVIAGTKSDLADAVDDVPAGYRAEEGEAFVRISSRTGAGLDELTVQIRERLPVSPSLYPEDELTDRPLRWLAGEFVRESVFECLGQELPYEMAVDVVNFDESRADLITIEANILVQRNSQKRITVGSGGAMIKKIGMRSRRQIEKLVGAQVHLRLFVKVDPKWLKNAKRIEGLGYH